MEKQTLVLKPEFVKVRNEITGYTGGFSAHELLGIMIYELINFISLGDKEGSLSLERYSKAKEYALEAMSPIQMKKGLLVDYAFLVLVDSKVSNPFVKSFGVAERDLENYISKIEEYLPFNSDAFKDAVLNLLRSTIVRKDTIKGVLESLTIIPTFCCNDLNEMYFTSLTKKEDHNVLLKGLVVAMISMLFPLAEMDNVGNAFEKALNDFGFSQDDSLVNTNYLNSLNQVISDENEELIKQFFDKTFTIDNLHDYQELFTKAFVDGIDSLNSYDTFWLLQYLLLKPFGDIG